MTSFEPLTHTPEPHCYVDRDPTYPIEEHDQLLELLHKNTGVGFAPTYEEVTMPVNSLGKKAFIIDNLFTEEECNAFISLSEHKGYEKALVNQHDYLQTDMPLIRNNWRTMMDTPLLASALFERVKSFIPQMYGSFSPVGLNERMRYLRYDGGQKFDAHLDGSFRRPNSEERSLLTFQLYLNDSFDKGTGCTRFLENNGVSGIDVQPKTGRVLIFEHDTLHSGNPPVNGRKYAIRTDVMFVPIH